MERIRDTKKGVQKKLSQMMDEKGEVGRMRKELCKGHIPQEMSEFTTTQLQGRVGIPLHGRYGSLAEGLVEVSRNGRSR